MTIEYIKKNVYGNEMLYIKNEAIAAKLRNLTGQKTINAGIMATVSDLFKVEFIQVLN